MLVVARFAQKNKIYQEVSKFVHILELEYVVPIFRGDLHHLILKVVAHYGDLLDDLNERYPPSSVFPSADLRWGLMSSTS